MHTILCHGAFEVRNNLSLKFSPSAPFFEKDVGQIGKLWHNQGKIFEE
jgi:hypothetical protein